MVLTEYIPDARQPGDSARETIEELARRQGVRPIDSVEELAVPGVFESDEELDEFLAWLHRERRRDEDLSRQAPADWDEPGVWSIDEWP